MKLILDWHIADFVIVKTMIKAFSNNRFNYSSIQIQSIYLERVHVYYKSLYFI